MKHYLIALACVSATCLVVPSYAEAPIKVDMKPGLWQNTMKYQGDGAEQMQAMYGGQMEQAMADMKKQMESMPPEQRKMMEEAMAASGVKFSQDAVTLDNGQVKIDKQGLESKQCVTQAEIDRGYTPEMEENCTSSMKQIGKNRFKSTQKCSGENASTMEAEIQFHSPTHYTGSGVTTQLVNGQTYTIEVSLDGKWLGAECGDVKPDSLDE